VATITDVKLCYDHPEPPVDVGNGLVLSRVVGTIKHRGPATVDVSWPGYQATSSPDHLYYSVSRRGYVPAQELQVGEFLRTDINTLAPVQAVSQPRYEMLDLYNVEVEHFHNYHVGQPGGSAVLVHNGTEYIQTLKRGEYDLVDHVASGKTLLVGEGNLSFARSLARKGRVDPKNLVVTTYEAEANLSPAALRNARALRERGATVLHGVDATDLRATFGDTKFDTILFNYPLRTAASRAELTAANRELLAGFFRSSAGQLNEGGSAVVTLIDKPFYRGWRIGEQAAAAGFEPVLQTPSQLGNFPGYQPVTTYPNVTPPDFTNAITYVFRRGG